MDFYKLAYSIIDPGARAPGFGAPAPPGARGGPCLEDSLTSFAIFEVSTTHRNGNARDLLEKRNTPGETLKVEPGVLRFSGLCHVGFWDFSENVW